MEEKRQSREMQQDKMFSLIEQCQSGKESVKQFCASQGIAASAYYYWLKKYKASRGMNTDFVPVRISSAKDEVRSGSVFAEITLAEGGAVKIFQPVAASFIQSLLK